MSNPGYWVVVPAAGVGRRMGVELPKQYLPLAGRRVLEQTLARLAHPKVRGIVVAVSAGDPYFPGIETPEILLWRADGGAERCHSVLNALDLLAGHAWADDWVLVHDAARPCLRRSDIERLMQALADHPVGGLLGLPVADTVKRTDEHGEVVATVDRNRLWRALTPQMFRFGTLRMALREALNAGVLVTDESAAIERIGLRPRMVEGHADNIKITRPQDLALAELYMRQQEEAG